VLPPIRIGLEQTYIALLTLAVGVPQVVVMRFGN
jgi:hypothetical protein